VAEIQQKLEKMGHRITYDWPSGNSALKKPYRTEANRKHNLPAQKRMLEAAANADIFILLDDPGLRGAYVELGAFLHDCIKRPEGRTAYIVGEHSQERQFVFESPGYVKFIDNISDVYADLSK
jgi:hypothetical protein